MGYPMSYGRMILRSRLDGNYAGSGIGGDCAEARAHTAGDLRRLEHDQRDPLHLTMYAEHAGVTLDQARMILDAFLFGLPSEFRGDFAKRHAGEHFTSPPMADPRSPDGAQYIPQEGRVL